MNTTINGIDIIGDCVRLINEALPRMCLTHIGYPYIEVSVHPCVILSHDALPHIKLWAQSLAGVAVCVNMDLPGIQRTLKELAESGAPWTDFQAVRYQFAEPVCNLPVVDSTIISPGVADSPIVNPGAVNSTTTSPGVVEPAVLESINLDNFSFDEGWFEEFPQK
ncbi:hypothetical protein LCI18_002299 [Fusarium solani-melongenae]|uniref:Uncharacterized protein n=1 Tax=Fusarium solani subsp. cucurbitae TaxID=2747967 RepID=A0ACD3YQW7_FUSSC|nr:hypothetical protein LCI18_002299 [Fusarium solani-melongenae]